MLRRLLLLVLAVFVLAPAALADGGGPSPGVVQGGDGLLAAGGTSRYVALPGVFRTTLAEVRTSAGQVPRWLEVAGSYGLPRVTYDNAAAGLSADGKTLVLSDANYGQPLKSKSSFVIVDTRRMRMKNEVFLKGDFAFDALSPDGSMLYLINHVSKKDLNRYVVRAFDLDANRLLPGRIADRTQRGWVMNGVPLTRATSSDGRWAYTLYQNPGGYPFVHALDTVRGVAHCIGIPFTGSQDALWNMRLDLRGGGRSLALHWKSGRPYLSMNTTTWQLTRPGGGFPWWMLGAGGGALLLVGSLMLLLRRRGARAGQERVERVRVPRGEVTA